MPRLTPEQRDEIRRLYGTDGWTQEALASHFDVTTETIAYHASPAAKARIQANNRKRYHANPEPRKAAIRDWHQRNREYRRAYEQAWRRKQRKAERARLSAPTDKALRARADG